MTDRAEVEWLIEDTKRVLDDQKKQQGGYRPGAGRPARALIEKRRKTKGRMDLRHRGGATRD